MSGTDLIDAGMGWPLTPDGGATPVTAAIDDAVEGLIAMAVPRPVGLNTLAVVVPGLLTLGMAWFNLAAGTGTITAVLPPTVKTWPAGFFALAVVIVGYPAIATTFPVLGIATAFGFLTTPANIFALAADNVIPGVMVFN